MRTSFSSTSPVRPTSLDSYASKIEYACPDTRPSILCAPLAHKTLPRRLYRKTECHISCTLSVSFVPFRVPLRLSLATGRRQYLHTGCFRGSSRFTKSQRFQRTPPDLSFSYQRQWSPVMARRAQIVLPPSRFAYEPQSFAKAFSSNNTHSSSPFGCANLGRALPPFSQADLSQGMKSSMVKWRQAPFPRSAVPSKSWIVYLPRGSNSLEINKLSIAPGRSAIHAIAAINQQSPIFPCKMSLAETPSW
mmetsp:Transcript_20058/g.50625  ORF Transcript_20058/g.50625 Transcript_20058/m.50625 type:complete len:248 (+) Transcript_20058:1478-2221(+)